MPALAAPAWATRDVVSSRRVQRDPFLVLQPVSGAYWRVLAAMIPRLMTPPCPSSVRPPEPKATGSNPVGRATSFRPFFPRKGPFPWKGCFLPGPAIDRVQVRIGSHMPPAHPMPVGEVSGRGAPCSVFIIYSRAHRLVLRRRGFPGLAETRVVTRAGWRGPACRARGRARAPPHAADCGDGRERGIRTGTGGRLQDGRHRSALPDLNESDSQGETPRAWRPAPRGLP